MSWMGAFIATIHRARGWWHDWNLMETKEINGQIEYRTDKVYIGLWQDLLRSKFPVLITLLCMYMYVRWRKIQKLLVYEELGCMIIFLCTYIFDPIHLISSLIGLLFLFFIFTFLLVLRDYHIVLPPRLWG